MKISKDFTNYKWITIEELKDIPHVGIEDELIAAEKIVNLGLDLNKFYTKSIKAKFDE